MNVTTRLNNLEKKVSIISKSDEPIWVCICDEKPCVCTEEHKLKHNLITDCTDCKWSNIGAFMKGRNCIGIPIQRFGEPIDKEELLKTLEFCRESGLPPPIMGGLSAQ